MKGRSWNMMALMCSQCCSAFSPQSSATSAVFFLLRQPISMVAKGCRSMTMKNDRSGVNLCVHGFRNVK